MEKQRRAAVWRSITPFLHMGGAGLLAALPMTLSVPHGVQAAAGDLDPTFGGRGRVVTNFGDDSNDWAYALVLQPDGKLVAAGQSFNAVHTFPPFNNELDFALARYRGE